MSNGDFWLAKTNGGWTVEDSRQIFALHQTHLAALAHRDRLANTGETCDHPVSDKLPVLPQMPVSDTFIRRFS